MATVRAVIGFLRPVSCICRAHCGIKTSTILRYKSKYNIEYLYPKSNPDVICKPASAPGQSIQGDDSFSGYIPDGALTIKYSRSSGPGGQNVNKVNTKVEMRFHVALAEWIGDPVRERLIKKEKNRITKDGFLIVSSDMTRSQLLNQADCLDKIRTMIFNAVEKPYEPTEDELLLEQKRKEAARKAVLRQKKIHSLKKQSRGTANL